MDAPVGGPGSGWPLGSGWPGMEDVALGEFDPNPRGVLDPLDGQEIPLDVELPGRFVLAFVGPLVERFARSHGGRIAAEVTMVSKVTPIWVIDYEGRDIALAEGSVGAPFATAVFDEVVARGCGRAVAVGSCGVLTGDVADELFVPVRALRDEGTSFHYQPPSRHIELDAGARRALAAVLERRGVAWRECWTWTTDAILRETAGKVRSRVAEGYDVVEMECSALAACARFRGVPFAQILYTSDSLARLDEWDPRGASETRVLAAVDLACAAAAE